MAETAVNWGMDHPSSRQDSAKLPVMLLLFILTAIMTFPLVTDLGGSIRDPGDPLLNSWIMAWNVKQLTALEVSGYFDANIFYPSQRTLAYSEHLFPQSLVAALPLLVSGNPVLAHNLVTLVSMLVTAYGMYLFSFHLTRDPVASVTAAAVFAFCPFMIGHLQHVQLLAAGGIPLAFLFLARFFGSERWRDLVGLGLVLTLQILANGYYAVYLGLFIPAVVAYHLVVSGRLTDLRFVAKLGACAAAVAVGVAPFMTQYLALQREMSFERAVSSPPGLRSFLQVPAFNWLYGQWFSAGAEFRLFPGFAAAALAVLGIAWAVRAGLGSRGGRPRQGDTRRRFAVVLVVVAGASVAAVASCADSGTGAISMLVASPFLALVRSAHLRSFCARWLPPLTTDRGWALVLVAIMGFSGLASLGPAANGPYQLLYEHVPGFNGLRSAARLHVMTMASLAVLAGLGLAWLRRVTAGRRLRVLLSAVVPVLGVGEYLSVPIPLHRVATPDKLPQVYRWLAEDPARAPILELPLAGPGPRRNLLEIQRVYASTVHWRPLVNGYSGYLPPVWRELRRRAVRRGPRAVLEDARRLGVRQVLVHTELLERPELARTRAALRSLGARLARSAGVDGVEVWDLVGPHPEAPAATRPDQTPIDRTDWQVSATVNPELAGRLVDGDLRTRWHSGPQEPGHRLTVDLGHVHPVGRVEMALAGHRGDFPRALTVEARTGAGDWQVVATLNLDRLPIESLLRPTTTPVAVSFPTVVTRHLRLTTREHHPSRYWSVHELEIW